MSKKSNDDEMYNKIIPELLEYADLEMSEWGEQVVRLTSMWQSRSLLSDELVAALEKEIRSWLKDVQENAVIVEEEIKPDNKPYKVKSLEWL